MTANKRTPDPSESKPPTPSETQLTPPEIDRFGNKKRKEDWDELDYILSARHYKRKAVVRKEIEALFQQALTTLREEMEKKKQPEPPHKEPANVTLNETFDDAYTLGYNQAISECQKLLEDKLNNGGTQHD